MNNTKNKLAESKQGFATILAVILILFIGSSISATIGLLTWSEQMSARNNIKATMAYYTAESGIEDAIYRLVKNKKYETTNTFIIGDDSVEINISSEQNKKIIKSTGASLGRIKNLQADLKINSAEIAFHYGAQVGEGGIKMGEHSQIQGSGGTAGNLYSNGPVEGDTDAIITGDVTVATGINLSEQSLVCNTNQIVGKTNPEIDFAQSFKASDSKQLAKISLYIKKVGSPSDATIKIANDISGSPSDDSIASATLDSNLVEQNYGWVDITFASPPNLTKDNTYWIILNASRNNDKYWIWCKDINNSYENGIVKYSQDWDDDDWFQSTGDLTFKTYLGTGISVINDIIVYGSVRAGAVTDSQICGDAYYQSIDADSKDFLNNPHSPCPTPFTPGADYPNQSLPPISPMPISQANIDQWKADAETGGVINSDLNIITDASLGPQKITGDLNLNANNKILTITGTLYIQGNIEISNGSKIKCDTSYNEKSCVIITDGWIHLNNNGTFAGSGETGSYLMFLTTLEGCNGGSQLPQCTHHNSAIDLHNNAAGAIFYAADSLIYLHNGVNVTEIAAYKLELSNNAIITYEQGLINAQFTAGPSASWTIDSWKEIE